MNSVKRILRDGVVDGEQAPAILLRDTVRTTGGPPLLKHLLRSICDNVSKGLSQAKVVVLVALNGTPEGYANLPHPDPKDHGPVSWFRLLDCYTDRLGWEGETESPGIEVGIDDSNYSRVYKDIRNLHGLLSLILESGQGSLQSQSKDRFVVFFDSISVLLRYHSLQALTNFLSTLRSHDQVAALTWLVHADLHQPRMTFAIEYLSSATIVVEPYLEVLPNSMNKQSESLDGGMVRIRQKRRSGRVREQVERFYFTANGLRFGPMEKIEPFESGSGKSNFPRVQFNLALTEKELEDRSKVLLPFEHQGNGQEGKIYDGRETINMSYLASQTREFQLVENVSSLASKGPGLGEIHYLRDSDDERPDSDEDPDDDLDI